MLALPGVPCTGHHRRLSHRIHSIALASERHFRYRLPLKRATDAGCPSASGALMMGLDTCMKRTVGRLSASFSSKLKTPCR